MCNWLMCGSVHDTVGVLVAVVVGVIGAAIPIGLIEYSERRRRRG